MPKILEEQVKKDSKTIVVQEKKIFATPKRKGKNKNNNNN